MTPYENRLHILTRSLTDAQARKIVFDGTCPEHNQSLTDPHFPKQNQDPQILENAPYRDTAALRKVRLRDRRALPFCRHKLVPAPISAAQ